MSPRAYSGHYDEFSVANTAQSSPRHQASEACPGYMANTESSRAPPHRLADVHLHDFGVVLARPVHLLLRSSLTSGIQDTGADQTDEI
jgi:hypothetical protein